MLPWGLGALSLALGALALAGPAWGAPAPPPLAGHQVLAQAQGDLNGDGLPDLVAVHARKGGPAPRPVLVHWGRPGGGFGPAALRSDGAVLRSDEGGAMGDPWGELAIQRGTLLLTHRGGSSYAWSNADRYAWSGGAMRLIGCTERSWQQGDPESTMDEQDMNLNTHLVAWRDMEPERPTKRGSYYELWAPKGAWGPPTRLVTRDFVRQGASRWRGPQDASVAVEASWVGERLRWRAKVQDDAPLPGDRMAWLDAQGRPVTALGLRRQALPGGYLPGGYLLEGELALAPLGLAKALKGHQGLSRAEQALSHPLLHATFQLHDEDPGEAPILLEAQSGSPHAAVLRLGCAAAPRLEELRRADFRWRFGDEPQGGE